MTAQGELQRMATGVLHFVPSPGGLLRVEHVCGRGGGELSQVPRNSRTRRKTDEGRNCFEKEKRETQKFVFIISLR